MGCVRQQPAREVLQPDTAGPHAAAGGRRVLAPSRRRHGPRARDAARRRGQAMMDRVREWLQRARAHVRRDALDADLRDELASHIQLATDEHIARGVPPDEARRLALVALGGCQPGGGAAPRFARPADRRRVDAGRATRASHDAAGTGLRDDRRPDPRPRHRRQHRGVQRRQHSPAAAAAVSRPRTGSPGSRPDATPSRRAVTPAGSRASPTPWTRSRSSSGTPSFQPLDGYNPFFGDTEFTMTGTREPQPVAAVWCRGQLLPDAGRPARTRPPLHPGRMPEGRAARSSSAHAFWQRHFNGDRAWSARRSG